MPNEEQVEHWDGAGGRHWAAEAENYDRMSRPFAERIVAALAPAPGERVLDVGCGNGALLLAIAPLVGPEGVVTGLDISTPMLSTARQRVAAAGLDNVALEQGDAQVHSLSGEPYDGLVSRFGVMFFDDPTAAFANLARALRPGGRIVFTCWRDLLLNDWLMVPAGAILEHVPLPDLGEPGGPGPFAFADPDRVLSVLAGAGLVDVGVDEVVAPMTLGATVDDAVSFMAQGELADVLLSDASPEVTARAWESVRSVLEDHADPAVSLEGRAWLVRARRP